MMFNDSYFEDEVRDGFFVPSEIKRAWAAELEVLLEIDKICKKHNIQYFADWGTLLATVRHEGFIPWDDDLDIVMKREDYRRFMEIAQRELPEGFSAYNFRNHDDLWLFLGRVVGKRRICFEEDHLERFHQFPYIAGVDIFVLDYVSRDKEAEQRRDELALHTIALADMAGAESVSPQVLEQELTQLEQICQIKISRGLSAIELRRELYGVVELLFDWFKEEEADELSQLFPFGLKPDGFRISKKCYETAIELPYENTRIPVPVQYCEMLERKYGDYMRLVRDAGGHDYPFFEAQKKKLQAVLDFEMPAYHFTVDQLTCKKDCSGYKDHLKAMMCELHNNVDGILQIWDASVEKGADNEETNTQHLLAGLQDLQQQAIDMGTLIEIVKGDGTKTVRRLEELCEIIYNCSVALEQQDIRYRLTHLLDEITEIRDILQKEILDRKDSVFFIYKAEHWKYAEWYWEKMLSYEKRDIYIVPVPYYYKKYDGTCYSSRFESDEIRNRVNDSIMKKYSADQRCNCYFRDYKEFDIKLVQPDQIIIQNPYDEWNQAITLPEEYYSRNLQKHTNHLVYIVPFQVEEFTKNNYREYHNMQYYCTMPGVVRADVVYVQSDNMRELYIQKLIDFAGEDTRQIWEKKIAVKCKNVDNDSEEIDSCAVVQHKKKRRKKIVFFVQVGLTIQYMDDMLKKIRSVFEIFHDNKQKVELIWIGDKKHDAFLKKYDSKFAERYETVRENFQKEGWGRYLDRSEASVSELVTTCDAYYGSASHIALEFEVKKKPVMIMDVEVR